MRLDRKFTRAGHVCDMIKPNECWYYFDNLQILQSSSKLKYKVVLTHVWPFCFVCCHFDTSLMITYSPHDWPITINCSGTTLLVNERVCFIYTDTKHMGEKISVKNFWESGRVYRTKVNKRYYFIWVFYSPIL